MSPNLGEDIPASSGIATGKPLFGAAIISEEDKANRRAIRLVSVEMNLILLIISSTTIHL